VIGGHCRYEQVLPVQQVLKATMAFLSSFGAFDRLYFSDYRALLQATGL
jgi:hypothetical protein